MSPMFAKYFLSLCAAASVLQAQQSPSMKTPEFEVASVKLATTRE